MGPPILAFSRIRKIHVLCKTGESEKAMPLLASWISRICRLFGYQLVRVERLPKPVAKKSRFRSVAVYDNDWED